MWWKIHKSPNHIWGSHLVLSCLGLHGYQGSINNSRDSVTPLGESASLAKSQEELWEFYFCKICSLIPLRLSPKSLLVFFYSSEKKISLRRPGRADRDFWGCLNTFPLKLHNSTTRNVYIFLILWLHFGDWVSLGRGCIFRQWENSEWACHNHKFAVIESRSPSNMLWKTKTYLILTHQICVCFKKFITNGTKIASLLWCKETEIHACKRYSKMFMEMYYEKVYMDSKHSSHQNKLIF